MQEVVEDTVELLAVRLQESQVNLRIQAPLPRVRADRVHVGEIFNNLIVKCYQV